MQIDDIVAAIDKAYESKPKEKARSYIGASVIGNHCDAYLAYALRGYPDDPPPPKLKRIFGLGHHIEDQVVKDLKAAGLSIIERDPMTNRQFSYEGFHGHAICHTDGLVEDNVGDVGIVEIKSMNDSNFNDFKSSGVLVSHPHYYAQMQMMMGMSKIPETLFVAYNKNTSEYHFEIVAFSAFYWASQQWRIERIMTDNDVRKTSDNIISFSCSGCFKRSVCYGLTQPKVECKSCKHAVAGTNAGWWCALRQQDCGQPCASYEVYEAKAPR